MGFFVLAETFLKTKTELASETMDPSEPKAHALPKEVIRNGADALALLACSG